MTPAETPKSPTERLAEAEREQRAATLECEEQAEEVFRVTKRLSDSGKARRPKEDEK